MTEDLKQFGLIKFEDLGLQYRGDPKKFYYVTHVVQQTSRGRFDYESVMLKNILDESFDPQQVRTLWDTALIRGVFEKGIRPTRKEQGFKE